jgi:hypothetical protein
VNRIDAVPPNAAAGSFAAQRRRESRRQEWAEQTKLAEMLDKYLDPADTFWTSLENKPISRLSGIFQKKRGVRSGLPDELVIWRGKRSKYARNLSRPVPTGGWREAPAPR